MSKVKSDKVFEELNKAFVEKHKSEKCSKENYDDYEEYASPITDRRAKRVEALWQEAYEGATLLPVIGLPSNANGVGTLTHPAGHPPMKINNLTSLSPLSNNALYSFEAAKDEEGNLHYLNLYEIMVPDIPSEDGGPSTADLYVRELWRQGLKVNGNFTVAGVHFHWWASTVFPNDRGVTAVHHQGNDLSPEEFTKRTLRALAVVDAAIAEKTEQYGQH